MTPAAQACTGDELVWDDLLASLPPEVQHPVLTFDAPRPWQALGGGGFGMAYRGFSAWGTELCVKLLASVDVDAVLLEVDNAMTAARLSPFVVRYRGICRVVGVAGGSRIGILLDLVKGETLKRSVVERSATQRRSPALGWCFARLAELGSALGALHAVGLKHLDVKPENVMALRSPGNAVRLIDFGCSTMCSELVGLSPGYAAPELVDLATDPEDFAAGVSFTASLAAATGARRLTCAADVFSFGVLALELICGAPAFGVRRTSACVPSTLATMRAELQAAANAEAGMDAAARRAAWANAADLLARCVELDLAKRPSLDADAVRTLQAVAS